MKRSAVISVMAVTFSVVNIAAADSMIDNNSGLYVGASVGYGISGWTSKNNLIFQSGLLEVDETNTVIYGVNIGYMFDSKERIKHGIELDYDRYQNNDLHCSDGVGLLCDSGKITNQDFISILGVLDIPFSQRWNAFAKFGLAYLEPKLSIDFIDPTNNNRYIFLQRYHVFSPEVALVVGYNFSPHIQFTSQIKNIFESKLSGVSTTFDDGTPFKIETSTPNYTAFTVGVNYMF